MNIPKILSRLGARPQAGFSTLMTMMLIGTTAVLLGATLSRTYSSAKLNDRYSYFTVCNSAAEAATEKVMSRMIADIEQNGEAQVIANINTYETSFLPNTNESPYWTNFQFSDVNGNTNQITVACISTNGNSALTPLQSQYPGLNGFCSTYAIIANVKPLNANYNFTSAVEQTVQLAEIPVFQFAIFYNSLLEFTTAGTLVVQGRVHANSNIYVGSASPLTFNYTVTTTGVITNPAWAGDTQGNYTGAVTYSGNPKTGTGSPNLVLPIGTTNNNPTNVIQILYPANGSDTLAMTQQRYWNKAEMVITVSNTTYNPTNTVVTIELQAPPANGMSYQDSNPYLFTNVNPITFVSNAVWLTNNFDSWLSTTNSFYDFRQQQYMRVTQINVSNFNTWCSNSTCIYTNTGNSNKFSAGVPLNIIYVGDWRATNSTTNTAVRLMGGGSSNFPPYGLTVATPEPLYVWGNYNTPKAANLNSTNVIGTYPTSFISDAFTILSASWQDNYSKSSSASGRPATSTTVNGAIITGVVYSTGPGGTGTTQYSGGVHNMPRMLENWGNGSTLTLNTSMVNLYPSAIATVPFQWPGGTVYGVPSTREFYFNQNYNSAAGLPPGTPLIYELIRADWAVVPPRTIVTNFQILDYVPQ